MPDETSTSSNDEVIHALDSLVDALALIADRSRRSIRRAAYIKRRRARGLSYREIVASEERPLVVEMLQESLEALLHHGANLRRAEARALYAEGMTMEKIASYFGVSRQRMSVLLKDGAPYAGRPPPPTLLDATVEPG